jgi:transposase
VLNPESLVFVDEMGLHTSLAPLYGYAPRGARQIVVMDNLAAHKPKRVRELIESRDCELLYLPAYSPHHNPIEEAFSKIKRFLREVGARTKDAPIEAIGAALSAVSPKDARSFFEHAGYRRVGQLL